MRIVKNDRNLLIIEDFCPVPIISTVVIFSYFLYMLTGMESHSNIAASFVILMLAVAVSFVIERRRFVFDKQQRVMKWSINKIYSQSKGQMRLDEVLCAEILELESKDCSNFSVVIKFKKECINITNYSNTDINNKKNREIIDAINQFITDKPDYLTLVQ